MSDQHADFHRLYMGVTLELPEVVYEWFLQERQAGHMREGHNYEEFLSRIIIKSFREHNPETKTPGLLNYEDDPSDH